VTKVNITTDPQPQLLVENAYSFQNSLFRYMPWTYMFSEKKGSESLLLLAHELILYCM